ncbi:hypothetical protein H0H93_012980 [Arthromyces matolae]|nr:hypothetical protein H0H93_012980 [Arthromyces matolae]
MVLKRKRADGEFIIWTPPGQTTTPLPPAPAPQSPATKKSRTSKTSNAMSSSSQPQPTRKDASTPAAMVAHPPKLARAGTLPTPSYASNQNYAAPQSSTAGYARHVHHEPAYVDPPSMQAGSSQPKPKRSRKKADPQDADASPPEKRLARLKTSCPLNIRDRVDRVMSQRFFMIDRNREGEELKETFSVLGSTGNVRRVHGDDRPPTAMQLYEHPSRYIASLNV